MANGQIQMESLQTVGIGPYERSDGSKSTFSATARQLSAAAGHHGFRGASVSSAVFNLSTTIIGAGIMGLPATVKSLGLPLAIIVLILMGVLTEISIEYLIKTATVQQAWSYSDLVGQEFGARWRIVLDLAVVVGNLGMCIVYLIIVADVFSGTFSGYGHHHEGLLASWNGGHAEWWMGRHFVIFLTMLLILTPLVCLKHVDSLQYTSAFSLLLALIFVVITVVIMLINLFSGTLKMPRFWPDLSSGEAVVALCSVIPIMATAYVCHFNVLPIYVELKERTEKTITRVSRISLIISSSIYTVTAISGYLLFTSETASDVLVNFDRNLGSVHSPAVRDIVRLTYALHIVLVFPVIFFSLREITDNLLFPNAQKPLIEDTTRFRSITAVEMILVYLGSVVVPNVWMAFDLTGATSTMILGLLFPAFLALRDKSGVIARWEKRVAHFMIAFSVIVSVTSVVSSIYYIAKKSAGAPGSQDNNIN